MAIQFQSYCTEFDSIQKHLRSLPKRERKQLKETNPHLFNYEDYHKFVRQQLKLAERPNWPATYRDATDLGPAVPMHSKTSRKPSVDTLVSAANL